MAGRIRTIKPELLEKARTAELPDDAWRLFVSMLLLADDYGNLDAHPRRLAAAVFWGCNPNRDTAAILDLLELKELIHRYSVRDQLCVSIVGWSEHQLVNHPGKPKVPKPGTISARESQESLLPDLDLEGNRREQKGGDAASAAAGEKFTRDVVVRLLAELSAARKRIRPNTRDIQPTSTNLEFITERLVEGYTPDDVRHVIAVCEAECRAKPDAFRWFNTQTPFRREPFARKCAADPALEGAASERPTYGRAQPAEVPRPRLPEARDVIAKRMRGGE